MFVNAFEHFGLHDPASFIALISGVFHLTTGDAVLGGQSKAATYGQFKTGHFEVLRHI